MLQTILHEDVSCWPVVDCLLSWHSEGFPLEKAQVSTVRHVGAEYGVRHGADVRQMRLSYCSSGALRGRLVRLAGPTSAKRHTPAQLISS